MGSRYGGFLPLPTEEPPSKIRVPPCGRCSMMMSGSSDAAPAAPLRIRQDDTFYCRLLTRESSAGFGAATPSFRVYYGNASGAVPFVWESQPGTPKHACNSAAAADDLPPLAPPPSHQSSPLGAASPRKASQVPTLLKAIVPRLAGKKGRGGASPTSPASYFSSVGSPHRQDRLIRRLSSARSPFSSMAAGKEAPAPCFTVRRGSHLASCGKMVKKALLSIVGHGSSRIASTP